MEVGQKLSLLFKDMENNQIEEYRCKIIGIDHQYIFIDYPINNNTQRTKAFSNGTAFLATYIDKDENLYQFHTKIEKRVILTIPGLAIDLPEAEKLKQIQRREYVRIKTAIDIAIHSTDQSFIPFTSVTNDISGGGISAIIPGNVILEKGQILSIWLVVHIKSEIKYIQLQGEVIQISNFNSGLQTASIKFSTISDTMRQMIIQIVFEKQREARKKELI